MPLGASVAGLPMCMGNTARSASRRAGQQAHHRRHARLHAELLENVLEMLLHRARAHVEDRGDLRVGLARRGPLQDFALARGESRPRGRRRKISLDGEADEEQKAAAACRARLGALNTVRRPRARSQMLSVVTSEATRRGSRSSPELAKLSRLQASAAISFSSFRPCSAMRAARVAMNSPQGARLRGNTYGVVAPSSGV